MGRLLPPLLASFRPFQTRVDSVHGQAVDQGNRHRAIVDVVSSSLLGIPLMVLAMSSLRASHLPPGEAAAAVVALMQSDLRFRAAQLLVGGACSVFAGYLAAWLARHDEVLNGAASSFLCVGLEVYSLTHGKTAADAFHIALLAVSPALGALGGYLRTLGSRRGTAIAA